MVFMGYYFLKMGIAIYNLFSKPYLKSPSSSVPEAFVSILIPARNEAHNLPHLFGELQKIQYPHWEVILLNDQSEDETGSLLQTFSEQIKQVSYLNGKPLPDGWLGKNWACHQLASHAKGEFLLFLDADVVEIHPHLAQIAAHILQKQQLALLSLFPNQCMKSWGERLVVPMMHYILLSMLPLHAVFRSRFSSFAAANGQFMMFRKDDYQKHLWHKQVKREVTEDISIMKAIKESGLKGKVLLSRGHISYRMYQSLEEGIKGFSKNLLAGFGNKPLGLTVFLLFEIGPLFLFPLFQPIEQILIWFSVIVLTRICISLATQEPVLLNVFLHPIQMVVMGYIGIRSIVNYYTGKNEWKGRNISLK